MKLNHNHIELKFYNFEISVNELSGILDLTPTMFWLKGDNLKLKPNSEIKRKANYWGYEHKKISNDFIGDLITDFIHEIIIPRKEIINKLTEQFHGELGIVQYYYDGFNPGLYFNKELIGILNNCGLELNIEFYLMSGNTEESDDGNCTGGNSN